MADINTVIAKCTDALDEALTVAGQPTISEQVAELNAEVVTKTARVTALESAVVGFKTRALARRAADATTVDGQDDIDAAEALGL